MLTIKNGRSLLALVAVAAIAVAACGGSASKTNAPSGNGGDNATPKPTLNGGGKATAEATTNGGGGGLSGAANNLSAITSYKFSMTIAGGKLASSFSMFGGSSASGDTTPFTMGGTIVTKPSPAVDITLGTFHIIELNGTDYIDMGTGTFMSTPVSGTSMADSLKPSVFFGSMMSGDTTGFSKVGSEQKNGVNADHYQGSQAVYGQLNSAMGVTADKWTTDIWIATDGGYPVSLAFVGTQGGEMVGEIIMDITNINDPSLKVTAPAGVVNP